MEELGKIEVLDNILKSLQPLETERQRKLDEKFRLEFNYNSNHLEGNTLTYSETKLLLIFDDAKGDHTLRELEEMKGSDVAYQLINEWAIDNERPLTEQQIRSLNEILLVRPFWKDAITQDGQSTRRLIKVGEYKEQPNSVILSNGEMFHYASPTDTPIQMKELLEWYREEEEKRELEPVVLAALFHYKFVLIHPFDDGNGRISRLLMNYVLIRNNLPPVVIKSEDKKNYLSALNRADAGDIESFTRYIGEQLIWSLEISIKAAKGESVDEPGDLDKKIKMLKQKLNSSNESIQTIKTKDSVLKTLEKNIIPLLDQISAKLKEFESLFRSKTELLTSNGGNFGFDLESSIDYLRRELPKTMYSEVIYYYHLREFRKGTSFSIDCKLKIDFHQNVYEITYRNSKSSLSKLYHEDLTQAEIDSLVEELVTDVYDQIVKGIG